ncbi:MAG TPA: bifunctional (p)ppGpp synthetase/guanosine-3',5'-bis(diphosphate) 3'-pyrophosphohydrolase, partial [Xanthomonadales bacterium]|nr:bifunctional (p)ppGpp synthetase/guanosine-3',5'-bis(diphosphate) 3'-pyrophosphohydrolase [Xanthomonadales bacterium]
MQAEAALTPEPWAGIRPRPDAAVIDRVVAQAATRRIANPGELRATLDLLETLGADAETIAAALAYAARVPDPPAELSALLEGQKEAERVWALYAARHQPGGAEGLRRLLLAIVRDLRVVFILLARQLARMRNAAGLDEGARRELAQLSADIHAPLANRLGIWQLKWELEDLAFRWLQPDTYKRVARLLDERRTDRERWIEGTIAALRGALSDAGIEADVAGRPKHIYSIWKKMQRKGLEFEHLHDIRAVRILVADVGTCYAALGVVHALWPPVPSEFDDYIARPKGNEYRSLHTAVTGPEGRTLEVQIRTHEMHRHAELGVAAHWKYKEGTKGDAAFERKVAWMRQLLDAKGEPEGDAALMAGLRTELVDDRVYLLTPQGKVIDLPQGATVLDFAYHVHTEVGHRCRGAKVNGRIAPLQHQPQSGDMVEILTGKTLEPRRDWLIAERGYLNTHRAREKARAWFKRADHERNVAAGRELLEKELRKLALADARLEPVLEKLGLADLEALYVAVGIGDVTTGQVARALHEHESPKPARALASGDAPTAAPRRPGSDGIVIQGVGNLLTQLARCCQPLPGDAIAGYLTRGRGASVHRAGCPSLAALVARDPDRMVRVEWGAR